MMRFDDYTEEEILDMREAFATARWEDAHNWVSCSNEQVKQYVECMIAEAIDDGVDENDAWDAMDERIVNLDDFVAEYGYVSNDEEELS